VVPLTAAAAGAYLASVVLGLPSVGFLVLPATIASVVLVHQVRGQLWQVLASTGASACLTATVVLLVGRLTS
jgi:hypothetical protein